MGLFDGYVDPDQFNSGGGLLGRLLALQQSQGQYQPGSGFDQASNVAPAPPPIWSQSSVQPSVQYLDPPYQVGPGLQDAQAADGNQTTPSPICQLPNGQIVSYQDMGNGYGAISDDGNGGLGFGLGRVASEMAMPTSTKTGGLAGGGKSGPVTSPASRILRDLTDHARYNPLPPLTRTVSVGGSLAKVFPFWGALLGFMDFVNMKNAPICSPTT